MIISCAKRWSWFFLEIHLWFPHFLLVIQCFVSHFGPSSADVDVWTVDENKITLFLLASPRSLRVQSEQGQGHTLCVCVCVCLHPG